MFFIFDALFRVCADLSHAAYRACAHAVLRPHAAAALRGDEIHAHWHAVQAVAGVGLCLDDRWVAVVYVAVAQQVADARLVQDELVDGAFREQAVCAYWQVVQADDACCLQADGERAWAVVAVQHLLLRRVGRLKIQR